MLQYFVRLSRWMHSTSSDFNGLKEKASSLYKAAHAAIAIGSYGISTSLSLLRATERRCSHVELLSSHDCVPASFDPAGL